MANTTGKKIKDAAIIGGCASLIYLTIGDISYRLSISRVRRHLLIMYIQSSRMDS